MKPCTKNNVPHFKTEQCCCNCKFQCTFKSDPWLKNLKVEYEGAALEVLYGCGMFYFLSITQPEEGDEGVIHPIDLTGHEHGLCEMWTERLWK